MYHVHHHHDPYKRNDKGYSPNDFKKEKPPTFDGEMKNSHNTKAWFLGMN